MLQLLHLFFENSLIDQALGLPLRHVHFDGCFIYGVPRVEEVVHDHLPKDPPHMFREILLKFGNERVSEGKVEKVKPFLVPSDVSGWDWDLNIRNHYSRMCIIYHITVLIVWYFRTVGDRSTYITVRIFRSVTTEYFPLPCVDIFLGGTYNYES